MTGNVLGFRDYGTEYENYRSAEEAATGTDKLSKYLQSVRQGCSFLPREKEVRCPRQETEEFWENLKG